MPPVKVASSLAAKSAVVSEIQFEFTVATLMKLLLQHLVPESILFSFIACWVSVAAKAVKDSDLDS